MLTVNVHEAKTHFSKLLDRAHSGEEIVVAKAGKPFAKLGPLDDSQQRVPGRYPGEVPESFFDDLPDDELEPWSS